MTEPFPVLGPGITAGRPRLAGETGVRQEISQCHLKSDKDLKSDKSCDRHGKHLPENNQGSPSEKVTFALNLRCGGQCSWQRDVP